MKHTYSVFPCAECIENYLQCSEKLKRESNIVIYLPFCVHFSGIWQSHRILECFRLEGTFRGHLAQPPCSEQGYIQPDPVAQSPVLPGLKCFQGWSLHYLSGQPVPVFYQYQLLLWKSDEFQVHSRLFCDKTQLFSDGNETAFSFQFVLFLQKLNIILYQERWQIVVIKSHWQSFYCESPSSCFYGT